MLPDNPQRARGRSEGFRCKARPELTFFDGQEFYSPECCRWETSMARRQGRGTGGVLAAQFCQRPFRRVQMQGAARSAVETVPGCTASEHRSRNVAG